MSLGLDPRQRAMLAEMGLPVFFPEEAQEMEVAVAPQPAREATSNVSESPKPASVARARPISPAGAVQSLDWDALGQAVAACRACRLCEGRRNTVFGVGDPRPDWLIVGEAPGEHEDAQGEPFVGQAGKLLDNMLKSVGLARGRKVFIANVLKCRPPGNRNPQPDEVAQCEPFLRRQVELLQPKIIVAMGRFAVQALLQTEEPIGRLRGRAHEYMGIPLVVTYHPAYLLRTLPDKAKAWADLCFARQLVAQRSAD